MPFSGSSGRIQRFRLFVADLKICRRLIASLLGIVSIMGICIYWEDERGNKLAELPDMNFYVEGFLPAEDATDFPCLRFVDPYGDTVFNQAQITQLISELERLMAQKHKPEVEKHLRAVLEFVRRAHDQTHTYIRFYGD